MESDNALVKGLSFVDGLQLLFIGLKLTGFIGWSWLWVLSPMWISFLLMLLAAFIS